MDKKSRKMKFSSIEDAAAYINSQLVLKGYLKQDSQLEFDSSTNDNRLIINTLNKLLVSLEDKNTQITELHAEKLKRSKELNLHPKKEISKEASLSSQTVPPKPVKVVKSARGADHGSSEVLARRYKVKTNKQQSVIEELKQQLQIERNRKLNQTDLTWQVHQDITAPSTDDERVQVSDYRDQLSQLLQMQSDHEAFDRQLVIFLETVNRYTYSTVIMGMRDMTVPEASAKLKELTNKELQELITDWYEIVAVAQGSKEV